MIISGLSKLTLLDYPNRTACTVFFSGCNLRCPFCHNAILVNCEETESITEESFFSFLISRRGRLDGVCISGGEPTLQRDLLRFAEKIKNLGFLVKLDTNGTSPETLSEMINGGLCDYVAMDIKNSPEKYAKTVGKTGFDLTPVYKSVSILKENKVDYEFRTTLVRGFHTENSLCETGKWLSGSENWFLQAFVRSGKLLGNVSGGFETSEYMRFLDIARRFVPNAQLRGV